MLLLTFAAHRLAAQMDQISARILSGDLSAAVSLCRVAMDRHCSHRPPHEAAHLGQLHGRCLMITGRVEEAEEVFSRQLSIYKQISRHHVRWLAGLDQGVLLLHQNKCVRAVEAFCSVADDIHADGDLRAEAMLGASVAFHRLGSISSAKLALDAAERQTADLGLPTLSHVITAARLEQIALRVVWSSTELDDHVLRESFCDEMRELPSAQEAHAALREHAHLIEPSSPMVARRLHYLSEVTDTAATSLRVWASAQSNLAWLHERHLSGFEERIGVESALIMLARGAVESAGKLIVAQFADERQVRHSKLALDLQYCLSRTSLAQGRVTEALQWYRQHSRTAISSLRQQAVRLPTGVFMSLMPEAGRQGDVEHLRLPVRYRRAYQYIMNNLHDENLCVGSIASHAGVTERALQMVFRSHLGLTPVELIRIRRVEGLRMDILASNGQGELMNLARKWGIKSRSTLVTNYRERFSETPSETLHWRSRSSDTSRAT